MNITPQESAIFTFGKSRIPELRTTITELTAEIAADQKALAIKQMKLREAQKALQTTLDAMGDV